MTSERLREWRERVEQDAANGDDAYYAEDMREMLDAIEELRRRVSDLSDQLHGRFEHDDREPLEPEDTLGEVE